MPFEFLPHSTHLCQPLDGKPFLSYKQHFRRSNNDLAFWAGELVGKADFLRIIVLSGLYVSRLLRVASYLVTVSKRIEGWSYLRTVLSVYLAANPKSISQPYRRCVKPYTDSGPIEYLSGRDR